MSNSPAQKVWIAGHNGMVGSAVSRLLRSQGVEVVGWESTALDLRERSATLDAATEERPDAVILAAARVGGIAANMAFPVQFLLDNVRIQANVLEAAHAADVNRLVFIASSCIYPRNASQPMRPEQLFTGPLEPTNESYAIAKLAGVTLVNSYRRQYGKSWVTCLPTNLYGPGDNFNPESSHVLAGLIHRFHVATQNSDPSVLIWGSGKPRRELLHVDDFATACAKILTDYDSSVPINVGTGEDVAISDLAELVAEVVGYSGEIVCDNRRPDGMPRKLLDVASLQSLGWSPQISLKDGVRSTYEWYRDHLT